MDPLPILVILAVIVVVLFIVALRSLPKQMSMPNVSADTAQNESNKNGTENGGQSGLAAVIHEASGSATGEMPAQHAGVQQGTQAVSRTPTTNLPNVLDVPLTRSGYVNLSAVPQRLPMRLSELLGEQRALEEAVSVARRRLEEIQVAPDASSGDNHIRMSMIHQDLTQKQERLQEIMFLGDGYRWLQQRMFSEQSSPGAQQHGQVKG